MDTVLVPGVEWLPRLKHKNGNGMHLSVLLDCLFLCFFIGICNCTRAALPLVLSFLELPPHTFEEVTGYERHGIQYVFL